MLDIDVKGALDVHKAIPCQVLFVRTSTIAELGRRLEARGTESPESLAKRLANAEAEVRMVEEHPEVFSKQLTNGDLEVFLKEASACIEELYHISL